MIPIIDYFANPQWLIAFARVTFGSFQICPCGNHDPYSLLSVYNDALPSGEVQDWRTAGSVTETLSNKTKA